MNSIHDRRRLSIDELLRRFENPRPSGGGYQVRCPAHEDQKASLNIKQGDKGILLKCHANCPTPRVVAALGLQMSDLFNDNDNGHHTTPPAPRSPVSQSRPAASKPTPTRQSFDLGEPVAVYVYTDEAGLPLMRVERYANKEFRQRRYSGTHRDGSPHWEAKLGDCRRVLYHLPELLAAKPDEVVWIVEGEKDADRLRGLGLLATTNAGGAGKWKPEYSDSLAGHLVAILPDNDEAGQGHATTVAGSLRGKATSVKIIELPGLPPKGDVSDWLDAGHTIAELRALYTAEPPVDIDTSRELYGGEQQDVHQASLKWLQLWAESERTPTAYWVGDGLHRLTIDGERVILTPIDRRICSWYFARLTRHWLPKRGLSAETAGPEDRRYTKPAASVVEHLLAHPKSDLQSHGIGPDLNRVTYAPIYTADGRLLVEAGFDSQSGIYHHPTIEIRPLPTRISEADVDAAKRLLVDELLGDFCFRGPADRANALACLLTPFVREMIAGPSPLHLVEASLPGTGKSTLIRLLLSPALGRSGYAFTILPERDEEELKKLLGSLLMSQTGGIVLDNFVTLSSPALAKILTDEFSEFRILGKSQTVRLPVRCVWAGSANNPLLSTEIARRIVRIRLDVDDDRLHLRQFKRPNIDQWANSERASIVHAAVTLIGYWIQRGAPDGPGRMDSYYDYARVLSGILQCAGIEGMLTNAIEFRDQADTEADALRALCHAWWEYIDQHKRLSISTSELRELADGIEGLPITGDNSKARDSSFGAYLKRIANDRHPSLTDEDGKTYVYSIAKRQRLVRGKSHWELTRRLV